MSTVVIPSTPVPYVAVTAFDADRAVATFSGLRQANGTQTGTALAYRAAG